MTERKSFKKRVRTRMEKTGERYTTARRHLAEEEPIDPGAHGLVADETIAERTGRTWSEWLAVLDRWGAAERTHTEIARYVNAEHGVPGWWSQTVTVGYERLRGRRALYEHADGYSIGASRTIAVPVDQLFDAVCDPAWPEEGSLRLRTAQPGRTARFDWKDGTTRIVVGFTAKGDAKSSVALQHERLPDAEAAEAMKTYWRERLAELKQTLEA